MKARQPHAPVLHKLSPDVTLREFKVWRSVWCDYEELLQLRNQLHRIQAHLRSCLTPEMRSTLAHAIGGLRGGPHPISGANPRTDQGASTVQRQRNIALRRVRFEERQQHGGELFDVLKCCPYGTGGGCRVVGDVSGCSTMSCFPGMMRKHNICRPPEADQGAS
ncbi:hypothetical protein Hamer_G015457 [Homarus americanus]|uniref:Uncharacterized protein n=1 Tax=Homarus americanus TaxID=6706 RepID=A0A8J5N9Z4_HOMAM|nr:hypothetical protein Hamer_G015457 [Homarus americanus]